MELNAFLELLEQRTRTLLAHLPEDTPLAQLLHANAPSLELARAVLAGQGYSASPPQIAVIGPTQSGKSTVVNLLLGQEAAGVSPLAGYTVHPQAFLHGVEEAKMDWLDTYFCGFRRTPTAELSRDCFEHFSVETVLVKESGESLPPSVVWDTPDFDSLKSRHYLKGVLRTSAIADVLVVVVSKDKYADRSVWDMLALLEPLQIPTLVCLNKLARGNRGILLRSWEENWRRIRSDPPPQVITLPYWHRPSERLEAAYALHSVLNHLLRQGLKRRKKLSLHALSLVRRHFPRWSAPVRAELEAEKHWREQVAGAIKDTIKSYRHDFLDHPLAYETLQRTIAELLVLLEIPGIARPMTLFRRVLTWPIRRLWDRRPHAGGTVNELVILQRSLEHALLQLRQVAIGAGHAASSNSMMHWWNELALLHREAIPSLLRDFQGAAESYYLAFQPQVEAAARELYLRLEEMPLTLNSLRAGRAFADAAGLALLLQTGGIGPHDFILAPAVLSFTSWLSESALGKYVDRVAADLRRCQMEAVRKLLQTSVQHRLDALPACIPTDLRFGIDAETLEAIETQLMEHRYGLHLF